MEVRIGVTYSPRELEVELTDDTDVAALKATVEGVLSSGSGVLWLTDRKGRQVGVPADKVAYVDIDAGGDRGRIGFGT